MVLLLVVTDCTHSATLEPIQHVQVQGGSLQNDLNEFLNVIPVDDIRNLTKFFYTNDEAMRDSYEYLRDEGIKLIVENLSTLSLVKKFTTFLNDTGVNFAELGKRVERIVLTREDTKSIVGNCSSLIDFVVALGANLKSSFNLPLRLVSFVISQRGSARRYGGHERFFQRSTFSYSARRDFVAIFPEDGRERRLLVIPGKIESLRL